MVSSFKNIWDPLGTNKEGGRSFVWVEELVWETLFGDLECATIMFDVDLVKGEKIIRLLKILTNQIFSWKHC